MNYFGSFVRQQEEWVQFPDKPGLWQHPATGYQYYEKSQLYAFYDQDAKQWKMYDKNQNQWYVYNADVFYCESPAVNGTCTTVGPVVTVEEETIYVPLEVFSEVSFNLKTKVMPLVEQLRGFENAVDQSGARPIMDAIDKEIEAQAALIWEKERDKGWPVAKFLAQTQTDLLKLKEYANPARNYREVAEKTVEIMELVAPGMIETPVFYQYRVWPWLAAAAAAVGSALLYLMNEGRLFLRDYGKPMAVCYHRSPGNWAKIKTCLIEHNIGPDDADLCIIALQNGLSYSIQKGWYKPEKKHRNVVYHPY